MRYIKPTCCKNFLYRQHRQLDFYFLMLFLKHGKELESFIFCGINAQIFESKKDIVSVPYLTAFEFLEYNSLSIIVPMTLKTSHNIFGNRYLCRFLKLSFLDVASTVLSNCRGTETHNHLVHKQRSTI